MATITTVSIAANAWTRIDSLSGHTYADVFNSSADESIGVRIAGSDPGAGTAWDAAGSWKIRPENAWPFKLASGDQVWVRKQTTSGTADIHEGV